MFSLNRSQIGCLLETCDCILHVVFMIRSKNTSTLSCPRHYQRQLNGLMCARDASKHKYLKKRFSGILYSKLLTNEHISYHQPYCCVPYRLNVRRNGGISVV